jgi:hypothetical protein
MKTVLPGCASWMLAASAALSCGSKDSEGTGPAPASEGQTPTGATGGGGASPGAAGQEAVTGLLPLQGTPTVHWDFTGIVGTGQSLSVGAMAENITPKAMIQPGNNLKLSLGTATVPPFNSDDPALSLAPLVEPIRPPDPGYPSAYPVNLDGESPHTAMAAEITALAKAGGLADFVTIHTVVGESGQAMNVINKTAMEVVSASGNVTGRAYAASLFEARAITRLAQADGKSYGIGAIFLTHGESDAGNANYTNDMLQLWTDYNADLKAITGQTQSIPLFTSQQHGIYMYAAGQAPRNIDVSTMLEWQASIDHPEAIVCTGPKYQYPYFIDFLHLVPLGYELMGEKYGQIFYQHVLLGHPWQPLQPLAETAARSGRAITVDFHVPVPPLAWDDVLPKPHQADLTEWAEGRGFEVRMGTERLTIESVELLDDDTVQITCADELQAGVTLGYAASSDGAAISGVSPRWGQLRDSDPFVGEFTQQAQANYAVSFELSVP